MQGLRLHIYLPPSREKKHRGTTHRDLLESKAQRRPVQCGGDGFLL